MQRNLATKIWAKREYGLTAVWLKRGPPVQLKWDPLKPDFWEHENLSGLSVIQFTELTCIKLIKLYQKIQAKWESSLTAVRLKWYPPV